MPQFSERKNEVKKITQLQTPFSGHFEKPLEVVCFVDGSF